MEQIDRLIQGLIILKKYTSETIIWPVGTRDDVIAVTIDNETERKDYTKLKELNWWHENKEEKVWLFYG